MGSIPAKAIERIKTTLKRFQPIIKAAKDRDINESDTVLIITDILDSMFGYDKFSEITSEHAIRGTYCDLAVKIDNKLEFLIEAKAVGIELKDQQVKQAIDYAANQGVEWVGLTNGVEWRFYNVSFGKPIGAEIVVQFNILELSHKKDADIEKLSLLAKESWKKSQIQQYYSLQRLLNKFTLGAILLTDPVLKVVKKEIKRLSSDIKISEAEIGLMIQAEVIKREILEGEKAEQARKQISKSEKRALKKRMAQQGNSNILPLKSKEAADVETSKKDIVNS